MDARVDRSGVGGTCGLEFSDTGVALDEVGVSWPEVRFGYSDRSLDPTLRSWIVDDTSLHAKPIGTGEGDHLGVDYATPAIWFTAAVLALSVRT